MFRAYNHLSSLHLQFLLLQQILNGEAFQKALALVTNHSLAFFNQDLIALVHLYYAGAYLSLFQERSYK